MKKMIYLCLIVFLIILTTACPTETSLSNKIVVNSIGNTEGESVTASSTDAAEGDSITLTAALGSGRQVSLSTDTAGVSFNSGIITTDSGTATFTMPADNVEISAVFSDIPAATYDVTISPSGAGAGESVTADYSTAPDGTSVTLTASLNSDRQVSLSTDTAGVIFSSMLITTDGGTATFTMPADDIDISVVFSDIPAATYDVTILPSGAGAGESVTADYSTAPDGTSVTLTASLNSGRQVSLSTDTAGVSFSSMIITTDGGTATFTMPADNVEISTVFSDIPATTYDVTISPSGAAAGESVTASPASAEEGERVTLTPTLNSGRVVTLGIGGETETLSAGETIYFDMPAMTITITAVFSDIPTYYVNINPVDDAAGESVTADYSTAPEGTTVTLAASLNSGRQVNLSASGTAITPNLITTDDGTATFTMPAENMEISAVFSDKPAYNITIVPENAAGGEAVVANSTTAVEGTIVTLTASLNSGRRVRLSTDSTGVIFSSSVIRADHGFITFTMPSSDVSISVDFYELQPGDPGYQEALSIYGVPFNMNYLPGGITFYKGINDNSIATVSDAFWIGETEMTYELWGEVYKWASGDEDMNGTVDGDETVGTYTFSDSGTMGAFGVNTDQHPVNSVSWRSAIVWCNALTEWYNALNTTDYMCVYYEDSGYTTPLRTSTDSTTITFSTPGSQDNPYIYAASSGNTDMEACTANGFRLPTDDEWELAARYIADKNNDGDIRDNREFYSGDSLSGADATYPDPSNIDFDEDGDIETRDDVAVLGESTTAVVKSKSPNSLGLYDMIGNSDEWCFDTFDDSRRILRGHNFGSTVANTELGRRGGNYPYASYPGTTFRLCRTAN